MAAFLVNHPGSSGCQRWKPIASGSEKGTGYGARSPMSSAAKDSDAMNAAKAKTMTRFILFSLRTPMPILFLCRPLRARAMLALMASVAVVGCGMLPPLPEHTPTAALKAASDSELVKIAERSRPAPELTGFRLMPLGSYALDARLQLAKRTTHSLDVQYYLIQNDMTGRLLMRNLRDAALRGVRVRLLVDDLYTTGGDVIMRKGGLARVDVRSRKPLRGELVWLLTPALMDA